MFRINYCGNTTSDKDPSKHVTIYTDIANMTGIYILLGLWYFLIVNGRMLRRTKKGLPQ
jgi:hypothetical protein